MPRDGSGAYTLPSGNPVATGTLIQSTWANTTMSDVAVQMNNVLTRDGLLGPTNPLKMIDGTQAAPSLTFNSEPGLGLWRQAASVLNFAASNASVASLDGSNVGNTKLSIFPRTAGVGYGAQGVLSNAPFGAANSSGVQLQIDDVRIRMLSIQNGTGGLLPFKLDCTLDPAGQIENAVGNCRLVYTSSSVVTLIPHKGNQVTINGVKYTIPSAGVTGAVGALAASTTYNVYVYQTAGVLSLEFSTTGHAPDTVSGQEVKIGDSTRTLVGKVGTIAGPAFVDTDLNRLVISWFNQLPRRIYNSIGSAVGTTSVTPVGIIAQMSWLSWGNSAVAASFIGEATQTAANALVQTAFSLNTTLTFSHSPSTFQAYAANTYGPVAGGSTFIPPEGFNFLVLNGAVTGGTGSWQANCEMSGIIQG